jgi:adenine-specific DNA-methyltransferase
MYSNLSYELTKKISKDEKKENGIYFTPPKTVNKTIHLLEPYMKKIFNILEPSCGSCEYILSLNEKYKNIKITGIELNNTIYESIKSIENTNIKIYNENFLEYREDKKYDLIIGNPPYFVMKKTDVDNQYYKYFEGRPNIFILFIIKSLNILNDNGILSFVLPKSFSNCLYYDKTRKYINDNYQILHIIENKDSYIETNQETITLIIKKTNEDINNKEYIINIQGFSIFGTPENIVKLKSLYLNSSTLNNLGFIVNVGNILWNQCKNELTNDSNKTLLIYSSDIKNKRLEIQSYSNDSKKNYIDRKGDTVPLLVINRGYGVGKYSFDYCLINEDYEYLIENHLICIKYKNEIDKEDLIKLYKKIITSFENKNTIEFIKLYFGNNAINTTELYNIFPIYDI